MWRTPTSSRARVSRELPRSISQILKSLLLFSEIRRAEVHAPR
jgi:signal transduction histidine kinase